MDRVAIEQTLARFIAAYPERQQVTTRWRAPIVGCAAAADPLFARYKEIIGPFHWTPEEALGQEPVSVGYSSHEGAERADWGDDKLELVGGTRPVVYPAAGSHANKFTPALYLGNSAETGVGCDDTLEPHREVRPIVKTIPSDPGAAREAFPWIAFEGRWGEPAQIVSKAQPQS